MYRIKLSFGCAVVLAVTLATNHASAKWCSTRCNSSCYSCYPQCWSCKDNCCTELTHVKKELQDCESHSKKLINELCDVTRERDRACSNLSECTRQLACLNIQKATCDSDREWLTRINTDLQNRLQQSEREYLMQAGFWQYQLADARREVIGTVREMAANKHDDCCRGCGPQPVIAHAPIVTNTPMATTPASATPMATTPSSTSPLANDPQTSVPLSSVPQSTNPQVSNPQQGNPYSSPYSNPYSTTPLASHPQTTNPQSSTPQVSNPQTSNPQTSNPQQSNPQTSNPQTSDPLASHPQSNPTSPLAPQFATTATPVGAAGPSGGGGGGGGGAAGGSGGSGGGGLFGGGLFGFGI